MKYLTFEGTDIMIVFVKFSFKPLALTKIKDIIIASFDLLPLASHVNGIFFFQTPKPEYNIVGVIYFRLFSVLASMF